MTTKKYKSGGTFITREMFECPGYNSLRGFAPQLLTHILGKRQFQYHGRKGKQKRVCVNCKCLNVTYTEFKNGYGISQPRMTRAIDQLLAKGFISIVHPGGTFRQDKAIYSLSDNWAIWQPEMVFEARQREGVKRGFCKPKKNVIFLHGLNF